MRLQGSVHINKPVEDVFAFVNDPTSAVKYESGLIEQRMTSEGPPGSGRRAGALRST